MRNHDLPPKGIPSDSERSENALVGPENDKLH